MKRKSTSTKFNFSHIHLDPHKITWDYPAWWSSCCGWPTQASCSPSAAMTPSTCGRWEDPRLSKVEILLGRSRKALWRCCNNSTSTESVSPQCRQRSSQSGSLWGRRRGTRTSSTWTTSACPATSSTGTRQSGCISRPTQALSPTCWVSTCAASFCQSLVFRVCLARCPGWMQQVIALSSLFSSSISESQILLGKNMILNPK